MRRALQYQTLWSYEYMYENAVATKIGTLSFVSSLARGAVPYTIPHIITYHTGLRAAREVGEGGINTKKAIINYHHRAAAAGVGWGGSS